MVLVWLIGRLKKEHANRGFYNALLTSNPTRPEGIWHQASLEPRPSSIIAAAAAAVTMLTPPALVFRQNSRSRVD